MRRLASLSGGALRGAAPQKGSAETPDSTAEEGFLPFGHDPVLSRVANPQCRDYGRAVRRMCNLYSVTKGQADRLTGTSWLRTRAPGFAALTDAEVASVADFTFLWTLFEARVLDAQVSARKICEVVGAWERSGTLDAAAYDGELGYFRRRYFAGGRFTYYFDGLNLRANDRPELVAAVLDGSDDDPRRCVTASLIIIFRYRNNLFHGLKWQYRLSGQLDNFTCANAVLARALERHGRLEEG